MRPKAGTALPIALSALVLLAVTASAADARTYLVDGGYQKLNYKPKSYAAGGVGASARAEKLRWSTWTDRRAVAHGLMVNNACDPSCAEGKTYRYPGSIVLSEPATCTSYGTGKTYRFFRRVKYTVRLPRGNPYGAPAGASTTIFRHAVSEMNGEYGACHQ